MYTITTNPLSSLSRYYIVVTVKHCVFSAEQAGFTNDSSTVRVGYCNWSVDATERFMVAMF